MKSTLLLLASLLLSGPALAKDLTVTLAEADQQAIVQIIDLALKNAGVQVLPSVNRILGKLQAPPEPLTATPLSK